MYVLQTLFNGSIIYLCLILHIDYLAKVDMIVYNLTSGKGHLEIRFTVSLSIIYTVYMYYYQQKFSQGLVLVDKKHP